MVRATVAIGRDVTKPQSPTATNPLTNGRGIGLSQFPRANCCGTKSGLPASPHGRTGGDREHASDREAAMQEVVVLADVGDEGLGGRPLGRMNPAIHV